MVGKSGKIVILMTVCLSCVFGMTKAELCIANASKAEEMSEGISGKILCVKGVDGADTVYAGTEDGLYRTLDGGIVWEKVDPAGGVFGITDIAIAGENIFIATGNGIYVSVYDASWEWMPGTKGITGVVACSGKEGDDAVLAWSPKELFLMTKDSRELTGPGIKKGPISDAACRDGVMFVASGADIYFSSDKGKTWGKIALLAGYNREEEADGIDAIEEPDEAFAAVRNIDPSWPEGAAIATTKGIFIIGEQGRLEGKIDTTGLPGTRLRYIACLGKELFAATDRRVFVYSDKERCWQPFFEKTFPGAISFLEGHIDKKGCRWLWIAGGRYLYKQRSVDLLSDPEKRGSGGGGSEPDIREVHRMAIEYAEVSPEKIRQWRNGAKWKAVMPRLSLSFSESLDDNIEIYKSASASYVVTAPRERGNDWGVDLTWDLSDLVWNDSQTSIDVRSKLMVQLRDEILEEVTRLYFERKRLLAELEEMRDTNNEEIYRKKLRVEELTAYIDALTGGKFSE